MCLGVCVCVCVCVCLEGQPSQCGRILGLLPCSVTQSSLGKLVTTEAERTHVPTLFRVPPWEIIRVQTAQDPVSPLTLGGIFVSRVCPVGGSPWMSNGKAEQKPNLGQGISTARGPGLKPSAPLNFNQEEVSRCTLFFPPFSKPDWRWGMMFTDPLKYQLRSGNSSAYKPSGSLNYIHKVLLPPVHTSQPQERPSSASHSFSPLLLTHPRSPVGDSMQTDPSS